MTGMKRLLPALKYAGAGVLATLAGMSAGHLVAAALNPASSPVLAVGSTVIDLTPTPMKEWAVREFGTKDKPILIGSVMLVTLLLTAVAGVIARRRFAIGAAILGLLVAVSGVLALLRPFALATDVVPAVAAAIIGVATLAVLVHVMRRADGLDGLLPAKAIPSFGGGHKTVVATTAHADGETDGKDRLLLSGNGRGPGNVTRRTVLLTSALVAVLSGGMGWLGQQLVGIRTRPEDVDLPAAADRAKPLAQGLENRIKGISKFQTPNKDFYRVDVNLTVPVIDLDSWRLEIDGDVENKASYSFDDLLEMELVERDITLTCVSNQVGGPYVGAARWIGVPLKRLLDEAVVGSGADQILSTATDGFTISTPLDVALDGRDTMIALGMNGEALPSEHGFPARLVTPGIYGFVGATKWLRKLTLTTYAEDTSYWTDRDWATDAPIKISSRIDTPQAFKTLKKENAVVAGVAWAQTRGIGKVEVADRRRRAGSRPSSAPAPASTTGASGSTAGRTHSPGSTCSRSARPPRTARCRPPPAPTRSPTARAASSPSRSTSNDFSRRFSNPVWRPPRITPEERPLEGKAPIMKRTIVRHGSIAALALTLSVGLAACGGDDEGNTSASDDSSSAAATPTEEESMATDASAETFGAGCSAIPTEGKGSFNGMVTDPVGTAASNNPLLKTLVAAVTEADLVDTLNSAPALTVFAPIDDAFAKIPKKDLDAVLADKKTADQDPDPPRGRGSAGPGRGRRHPRHPRR